ncbi:PREDICTED: uncharacterized protein LOC108535452 isoform X2 [Rhinopithecus bieti]|uniref:uncharacterized protein LOC108535452 isoform X2 n=1 Tax=Rhinopithecus bieti TaxID=61621 RepID=UPI00083C0065|nr:PREDICTED: uncharacterized protein LOC108535452 isoform X2 [Rhinopithecus bieti]
MPGHLPQRQAAPLLIRSVFPWCQGERSRQKALQEVQQPSVTHWALGKTRLRLKPPRKAKSEFHYLKRPARVQAALRKAGPHRSPCGIWRWPPGEEKADARARLVRRKRLTRRFGQQNRPSLSEASSDLARRVGEGGLVQRLRDPPLWGRPSLSLTLHSTAFAGGISE